VHVYFSHESWCGWNWYSSHCHFGGGRWPASYNRYERADIVLYDRTGFGGYAFGVQDQVSNFHHLGFNDRASSVRIERGTWELCEHAGFRGYCIIADRDIYDLRDYGFSNEISSVRRVSNNYYYRDGYYHSGYYRDDYRNRDYGVGVYASSGYGGDYFEVSVDIEDFQLYAGGYNGSLEVLGGRWQVCDQSHYRGHCSVVEGRYDDLSRIGFAAGIGSIRLFN
jgi:hypothetical protein